MGADLPPASLIRWALANGANPLADASWDDNVGLLVGVVPGRPLTIRGHLDAALWFHRRVLALAWGNPRWAAAAHLNLATVEQARRAYPQALQNARAAYQAAERAGSPEVAWRALATEGVLDARAGRLTPAVGEYGEAIHVLEGQRANAVLGNEQRLRYLEDNSWLYRQIIDVLVRRNARGDAWAALTYSERIKGRLILDLLLRGKGDRSRPQRAPSPRPLSLNAAANNNGSHIGGSRRASGRSFTLSGARLAQMEEQDETPSLSPRQVLDLLPDRHAALMEFCFSDTRLILFLLTPPAHPGSVLPVLHVFAVPRETADRLATAFQQAVSFVPEGGQPDPDYYKPAHALYEFLPAPVRAQLAGCRTLGIVPDGALWYLPFGALVSGFQGGRPHCLAQDTATFDAYSLDSLWETQQSRNRRPRPRLDFVGFGNVVAEKSEKRVLAHAGSPRSLGPTLGHSLDDPRVMPLVKQQLEASRGTYNSDGHIHGVVFVGAQVTKARYASIAGQARIVQIMSHGIFDSANPLASYLRLSPSPMTGRLSAADILRTPLRNELLILAACETGRGPATAGEGLIGMTWAAARAGCPSTLASQWQIPFDSTALLMRRLHALLAAQCRGTAPPLSKAEILRKAELQVLHYTDSSGQQPYNHPYFWAGFTLIGDGGTLDRRWVALAAVPRAPAAPRSKAPPDGARLGDGIEVGNGSESQYTQEAYASPGDIVQIKVFLGNTGNSVGRRPLIYFHRDARLSYIPKSSVEYTKQDNVNIEVPVPDSYIKFTKGGMSFAFGDMAPRPEAGLYLTFQLRVSEHARFAKDRQGNLAERLPVSAKCTFLGHVAFTGSAVVFIRRPRLGLGLVQAKLRMEAMSVTSPARWYSGEGGDPPAAVVPGDLVDFRSVVINQGTEAISGGRVRVYLPRWMTFAGKTRVYDDYSPKGRDMSGRALVTRGLPLPLLKPGNSHAATVTFRARVENSASFRDGAIRTVTGDSVFFWEAGRALTASGAGGVVQQGAVLANGEARVSICARRGLNVLVYDQAVAADADADPLTTSTSSQTVGENEKVKYRVLLENYSARTLRNVTVCIIPPACSSFVPNSLRFDGAHQQEYWALVKGVGIQLTDMVPGFCQELTFEVGVGDNLLDSPILRPIVQVKTSTPVPVLLYEEPVELVRP